MAWVLSHADGCSGSQAPVLSQTSPWAGLIRAERLQVGSALQSCASEDLCTLPLAFSYLVIRTMKQVTSFQGTCNSLEPVSQKWNCYWRLPPDNFMYCFLHFCFNFLFSAAHRFLLWLLSLSFFTRPLSRPFSVISHGVASFFTSGPSHTPCPTPGPPSQEKWVSKGAEKWMQQGNLWVEVWAV